jgi:hypothetical protein
MGPLAHAFKLSGPSLGRPPYSFLLSLGDVVSMVPILVTSITGEQQQEVTNRKPQSWKGKLYV